MAARAKKAKAAPELDAAEQAIAESIQRARRVFASGSGTTLALLREADRNLAAKLQAIVAKQGGPKGTFSEGSAVLYRKQIKITTDYLERRLAGHTHEQAVLGIRTGLLDTVTVARALERKFTGITVPLALDRQQFQDETIRGTGASLLRRHQASADRYGRRMVEDFERQLRAGALEGLTHEQMVSRLVSSAKAAGISGKTLHENEPAYFPKPTGYVRRRYWAERIVRTETAYALNAASLQGMNITRNNDFPDLKKKILATFDVRTAPDSVAVHGQIRRLEEMFVDGAGRHYLHPPARPHDRETIIPWRPRWEEGKITAPVPPKERVEAEAEATGNKLTEEQRREKLREAMAAAKARLEARKKPPAPPKQADTTKAIVAKRNAEELAKQRREEARRRTEQERIRKEAAAREKAAKERAAEERKRQEAERAAKAVADRKAELAKQAQQAKARAEAARRAKEQAEREARAAEAAEKRRQELEAAKARAIREAAAKRAAAARQLPPKPLPPPPPKPVPVAPKPSAAAPEVLQGVRITTQGNVSEAHRQAAYRGLSKFKRGGEALQEFVLTAEVGEGQSALPKNVGGVYSPPKKRLRVGTAPEHLDIFLKGQDPNSVKGMTPARAKKYGEERYVGMLNNVGNIAKTKELAIESTTVHEFAHHIHTRSLGDAADLAIRKAYFGPQVTGNERITDKSSWAGRQPVSAYGDSNLAEFWAEAVTGYHYMPRAWMVKHAPETLRMVEQVLKMKGQL